MDTSYPSDLDSYLDLTNDTLFQPSPSSSTSTTPSMSRGASSPQFSAPSHPYNLHPQTIGFNDPLFDMPIMQMEGGGESSMPAFFFPESTAAPSPQQQDVVMDRGISPLMTVDEVKAEPSRQQQQQQQQQHQQQQQRQRYYAGIHQEMFNEQQRKQQQQRSRPPTMDDRINQAIVNYKGAYPTSSRGQPNVLPHIARMKKDQEEMDEDERLLASEEGKKLTSKERRQLRNKVSARAFRSRRKEYIGQLEAEVAKKANENQTLAEENARLQAENQRLEDLTRLLLRSDAFSTFLDQMSAPVAQQFQQHTTPAAPAPAPSAPTTTEPSYNPSKDRNPATQTDDWALAYPTPSWSGMAAQVFRVDLPDLPLPDLSDDKLMLDEDYTIADGFFPMVRNEKAEFDLAAARANEETVEYAPPQNLEDVEVSLDDMFPGVGVTDFLERLEKVASGTARPEDVFDNVTSQPQPEPEMVEEQARPTQTVVSNRILQDAEGVYRRIGMMVQ